MEASVLRDTCGRRRRRRRRSCLQPDSEHLPLSKPAVFSFVVNGIQQPPALITVLQLIPVLLRLTLIMKLVSRRQRLARVFQFFLGGGRCEAEH